MKRLMMVALVALLLAGVFALVDPTHAFAASPSISGGLIHWDSNGVNETTSITFQCDAGDTAVVAVNETDKTRIETGTGSQSIPCTGTSEQSAFSMIEVGIVQAGDEAAVTASLDVFNVAGVEVGSDTLIRDPKVELCLNAGFCLQII
jgi:hypothetical protein